MERLVLNRENHNLSETDSSFHMRRMKELYFSLVEHVGNTTSLKLGNIYEVKLISLQKICLQTDIELVKNHYVSEWICPILKLFTAEQFIEVFTLVVLEEKVVFVCSNTHILTHMVYLFSSLLPKPFYYPYPVVTMIPQ